MKLKLLPLIAICVFGFSTAQAQGVSSVINGAAWASGVSGGHPRLNQFFNAVSKFLSSVAMVDLYEQSVAGELAGLEVVALGSAELFVVPVVAYSVQEVITEANPQAIAYALCQGGESVMCAQNVTNSSQQKTLADYNAEQDALASSSKQASSSQNVIITIPPTTVQVDSGPETVIPLESQTVTQTLQITAPVSSFTYFAGSAAGSIDEIDNGGPGDE